MRQAHLNMLRGLAAAIPSIESLSVGFDVLKLPRSYDTGLVAVFKDREALNTYTMHPEHVKVVEFGGAITERIASVDFEN